MENRRVFYIEIEGYQERPEIEVPDNEDFLPIVIINKDEEMVNGVYFIGNCNQAKTQILDLGSNYDKDLQKYLIPEITIAKNSKSYIPLKNIKGYDGWGIQDGDGILEFKPSNTNVKIRVLDEDTPKKCNDKTKLYNLKDAELNDKYCLEVSCSSLKRGSKFYIEIWASDDNDGLWGKSNKKVLCGKLNFTVVQRDVFLKEEMDKLINEINYLKKYADNQIPPEYDENYCMQAAERGLSELLNNQKDFYAVERETHIHKNNISFNGLNANDRGSEFYEKGFVIAKWEFNSYSINQKHREMLNKSKSDRDAKKYFNENLYDFVKPSNNKNMIFNQFKRDIGNKIGFHTYYLSITGDFHTLLLIIDNRNLCTPTYVIYDQHGETSSKGSLIDIGEGLAKQTSWTFANTCLNRYKKEKSTNEKYTDKYDSTITKLWKIQR